MYERVGDTSLWSSMTVRMVSIVLRMPRAITVLSSFSSYSSLCRTLVKISAWWQETQSHVCTVRENVPPMCLLSSLYCDATLQKMAHSAMTELTTYADVNFCEACQKTKTAGSLIMFLCI